LWVLDLQRRKLRGRFEKVSEKRIVEFIQLLSLENNIPAPKIEFWEYLPAFSGPGYHEGEYDSETETIRLSLYNPEGQTDIEVTALHEFVHHYVHKQRIELDERLAEHIAKNIHQLVFDDRRKREV